MERSLWESWRRARSGPRKQALLAKLLADNEALAVDFIRRFSQSTQYYVDNMRDDLLQAARIGIMRALPAWDPDAGGFNNVAWFWMLHEVQQVVRHATGVSVPKSAFLPRKKQDEIAKFVALYGHEPLPEEVGLTSVVVDRARKATATFGPLSEADDVAADDVAADSPEERIDRERDQEALKAFLATLEPEDRRELLAGNRSDLAEQVRDFIEARRNKR